MALQLPWAAVDLFEQGGLPDQRRLIAPGGMGLGVVELVDVRPMTEADVPAAMLFDDDVEDALKGFAWHVKPLYEVIPFPVKGKLNFFEVDDDFLKRLPDGYEDHCDYMYRQGLRWKDEDDPLTLEEFLEQQGSSRRPTARPAGSHAQKLPNGGRPEP